MRKKRREPGQRERAGRPGTGSCSGKMGGKGDKDLGGGQASGQGAGAGAGADRPS